MAQRVRTGISSRPMQTSKGPVSVTCSVGVACRDRSDETLAVLVERADQAMYTAKSDGRDRVISLVVGASGR